MSTTIQELRELATRAQEREGRPDTLVPLMMERWWPVEEEDPERVQLFKNSGPWGDVGFRWMRFVNVRFRADEILAAVDHVEAFTSSRAPQGATQEGEGQPAADRCESHPDRIAAGQSIDEVPLCAECGEGLERTARTAPGATQEGEG